MKESRLFKIVYYLLDRGQVTAGELAEEFEVSVRTVYRDVDALSSAGIPVYCTQGKGGGISLMDRYVLDRGVISEKEQQTIMSALKSMAAVMPKEERELLMKLGGLFRQDSPDWIYIDFVRWGSKDTDHEKFAEIKSAILNRRVLEFAYIGSGGEAQRRRVKPARICYKDQAWYLQAYCLERQAFRTFKLNRIIELECLAEYFEETLEPPLLEAGIAKDYPLVRLRFPKEVAYRIYDEFDISDVSEQEKGAFIVESRLPVDAWLYGYLLSFGGMVEVLEPQCVKNTLADMVRDMYTQYVDGSREK